MDTVWSLGRKKMKVDTAPRFSTFVNLNMNLADSSFSRLIIAVMIFWVPLSTTRGIKMNGKIFGS